MPIEKDLKNTIETFNSTSDKTGVLSTVEKKKNFFNMKKLLSTHRFQSRKNFLLKPINLATVLTFLPFAFGFTEFAFKKCTRENSDELFNKNLPAFTFLKPKINFETFEYIYKANLLNSDQTKFIDFSFKKNYDKTFLFGHPKFIAKLQTPKQFSRKKFNGLSYNFYTTKSLYSLNNLYNNLDELPSYLQGFFQSDENLFHDKDSFSPSKNLALFSKKPYTETVKIKPLVDPSEEKSLFTNKNLFQQKRTFLIKLTPTNLKENLNLVNTADKQRKSLPLITLETNSLKNNFYKNRLTFYKNLNHLNTELQNLFIEKTIWALPNTFIEKNSKINSEETDSTFFKKLATQFSEIDETVLIDTLLQDFNKKLISNELTSSRLMSGYKYPDMTRFDLRWFYTQKSLFGDWVSLGLKLEKSTLLSGTQNYNFTITNLPTFLIETKKVMLKNLDHNKVYYNGPALFLDPQKALDWKTHGDKTPVLSNDGKLLSKHDPIKQTLRSWCQNYISPFNPLIQPRENFFGIFHSPQFSLNKKNPDFSEFTKKSLLQLKYNPQHDRLYFAPASIDGNFASFKYSVHIPSSTSNNSFVRGLDVNLSPHKDSFDKNEFGAKLTNLATSPSGEQFVPVIQIQFPKFTTKTAKLTNYSPIFDLGITGKLDYNISTDFLAEKSFVIKRVSGRYKKISSVFSKKRKSNPVLVDNWEPLTSNSWLVVSQLSFAVFVFQTLKALADTYGRELLGYLLDLVSAVGFVDDSIKKQIEILMGQREKGFRVFLKSRKNFKDIAGIKKLLPEIYELIWFLRNSAREFALSKTLPHGVLLIGPPGTGKTLLVQALAGEAQVPVVALSGSSLIEPGASGAVKLELAFQEARQLAPCILFIDEMDTLAQKRSKVSQHPMGRDELVESLALSSYEKPTTRSPLEFISKDQEKQSQLTSPFQSEPKHAQLSLLMQLLIEVDGIKARDGVIVIGATNRPEVLDPAILRPGRFDKILHVDLPGQQKRIDILKLYGQSLGYESEISWNYLGQRTAGFTAADLATLMNESAMKAILNETAHTIETIEHGIDRITSSQSEKHTIIKRTESFSSSEFKTLSFSSKLAILRFAYYQAGKIVVSHILETHPKVLVAYLWPRRTTIRSLQITTNLQNSVFQFAKLGELNERVIGSYAGKAAEFLFLENFSKGNTELISQSLFSNLSTLGLDDLLFAQKLIYSLLEKWSFYSKQFHLQKTVTLLQNLNTREFYENEEKMDLYNDLMEGIETPPMIESLEEMSSLVSKEEKEELVRLHNRQRYHSIPWWQEETSNALEFVAKNTSNWSRLYLWNPEQNERNPEWFPPDEFYHSSRSFSGLKNVKIAFHNLVTRSHKSKRRYKTKTERSINFEKPKFNSLRSSKDINFNWNEVAKITRDYSVHSLVLQGFNKALLILNQNRELLDRIVIELLYQEILRKPELDKILADFKELQPNPNIPLDTSSSFSTNKAGEKMQVLSIESENQKNALEINSQQKHQFKIIESSWGIQSRKKLPRWIDFVSLK